MHYRTKWRIRHAQSSRCTNPRLRNCQDNGELACHCTARYKMEWIYTQTKVSGQGSLELAQEIKKKERKIEKWLFFKPLVLTCKSVFDE